MIKMYSGQDNSALEAAVVAARKSFVGMDKSQKRRLFWEAAREALDSEMGHFLFDAAGPAHPRLGYMSAQCPQTVLDRMIQDTDFAAQKICSLVFMRREREHGHG